MVHITYEFLSPHVVRTLCELRSEIVNELSKSSMLQKFETAIESHQTRFVKQSAFDRHILGRSVAEIFCGFTPLNLSIVTRALPVRESRTPGWTILE
jgi:hypothetical protein